jgi:glycosyltransferase involved in cell wall biosynthesis
MATTSEMRLLIATERPTPPFFFGGVEVNNKLLGRELVAGGHDVLHLGSYTHPRWRDERLLGSYRDRLSAEALTDDLPACLDGALGYRVDGARAVMTQGARFRAAVMWAVRDWRPDVVLTTCAGSATVIDIARDAAVPSIAWVQDASDDGSETAVAPASATAYASEFLRDHHTSRGGRPGPVIHPPFQNPPEAGLGSPGTRILMINPIPEKGDDVFLGVAERLGHLGFDALTGWRAPAWAGRSPMNVRCLPQQEDPSSYYRAAALVLVPSRVPEGFGRVPVEAALHGRRALCHAVGGLGEASGVPDNLLTSLDPAVWAEAVLTALADLAPPPRGARDARRHARRFVRPLLPELLTALS